MIVTLYISSSGGIGIHNGLRSHRHYRLMSSSLIYNISNKYASIALMVRAYPL